MKKIKLISRLLIAMLAVCVLSMGCEAEGDEVYSEATYTITFESNGGSSISGVETNSDGTVTQPADPELEGYTFDGWYSDSELTTSFDFESTLSSDFTLYAKWSLTNYTVSFYTYYADVTNSYESVPANLGDKISRPDADPTRTGYTFDDWYGSSAFEAKWDFDNDAVGSGDLTIFANWTLNGYSMAFVSYSDDVYETITDIEYGTTVAEPTAPSKYGYTFAGWYDNAAYDGFAWDFDLNVVGSEGVTLYAKWDFVPYTVTFDLQTGSIFETQTVDYLSYASEPESVPTSSTAVFIEWCEDAEGTTPYDFENTQIEKDITLYANWEVPAVVVQFWSDPEGYSTLPEEAYYTSLSMDPVVLTDVEDPRILDYRFMGWYTDINFSESTKVEDVSAVTFDAAQTSLYAKYVDEFTVTFDLDGGSVDGLETTQYFLTDETVSYPGEASRTGYRFDGWFLNDSDDKVDYSTPIRESFTITAKWTQVFKIGFNFNSGVLAGEYEDVEGFYLDSVEIGTIITNPGIPTRYGYEFLGWCDGDYGTGTEFDFEEGLAADVTLAARWRWSIGSLDVFTMFRDAINDGTAKAESVVDAVLTADITLTEEDWMPIGSDGAAGTTIYYNGVFDGQEHTIYGLKMTPTTNLKGLFGVVSLATIKNLRVANAEIVSSAQAVAVIVGSVIGASTFTNLQTIGGSVTGNNNTAGVIGYSNTTAALTIENCHNYGTQINKLSGSNAGGIIGVLNTASTITNCTNSGFINSSAGTQVGGIVGIISKASTITACANYGVVSNKANATGGICGTSSVASTKFIACYNQGSVSTTGSNCGGIVGQNGAAIYVVSCYNAGDISAIGGLGAIVGNTNSSTSIMACYSSVYPTALGNGKNGITVDAATLKASTVVGIMNGTLSGSYEIDYKYEQTGDNYPVVVAN